MHLSWTSVDAAIAGLLLPLGVWILLNGLDDIFVDFVAYLAARRNASSVRPSRRLLLSEPQKPIAIIVPLWNEAAVIARMVQQNSSSILYSNYHIFVGAYPNDEPTLNEIRKLETRYAHVHLAVCPHDGPTSKADCLNWIFQNVLAYEQAQAVHFEIIVTHDAEDVIHSDALHWINHYSDDYEMVQVPVLPLPKPITDWTYGVYVDEFTEYQTRDMPARQAMGAFVPSNGVGAGFRRDALDALAEADENRVFEPVCLTEDYENGLRLRAHGARQLFVPLQANGVATREYFPDTLKAAIRQKTRWITGIALQTWERHGWIGGHVQKYWLWRDRKGLVGSPAGLLTNLVFAYGLVRWLLGAPIPDNLLMRACAVIGSYRMLYRTICVWRIFGAGFALTTPIRVFVANFINSVATFLAFQRFFVAKLQGVPLVWVKTEHAYPCQSALIRRKARFGEVLVTHGYITESELQSALATQPAHRRIGEHLVARGSIDEEAVYEALCLQQMLPQARIDLDDVPRSIVRALPVRVATELQWIPFKVDLGRLFVAGPELPTAETRQKLQQFTSLAIEFHLVTPAQYRELASQFLPA
ncbi:MAG TPA: glycosyl transferase family protein [Bryobacteraceae bacterium]|nr:glycosyl transferase family protein [Bryobacteraceae bacterium]